MDRGAERTAGVDRAERTRSKALCRGSLAAMLSSNDNNSVTSYFLLLSPHCLLSFLFILPPLHSLRPPSCQLIISLGFVAISPFFIFFLFLFLFFYEDLSPHRWRGGGIRCGCLHSLPNYE